MNERLNIGDFGEMSFVKLMKRKYPIKGESEYMDYGYVMFGTIIDIDDEYIIFKGNDIEDIETDTHLINKKRIRRFEKHKFKEKSK